MVDLVHEAFNLQNFLQSQHWRFCFIGGLAVQVWGEPRLTRDIDLSLMTGFGNEASFVDTLLLNYSSRLPDAREFALRHRTLLLRSDDGVAIDVSLAALPYEDTMMDRAVSVEVLPAKSLKICSPEDLLIMKVFAGRDLDLRDARTVITRQKKLEWPYIEENLQLLDELSSSSGLVDKLKALRSS